MKRAGASSRRARARSVGRGVAATAAGPPIFARLVDVEDVGGDLAFCRVGASSTRLALVRLADGERPVASLAFDVAELAGLEDLVRAVADRLGVLRRVGTAEGLPATLLECGRIRSESGLDLEARIAWPSGVELIRTDRQGRALASLLLTLREAGQLPSLAGDALPAARRPQRAPDPEREVLCRTRRL